MASIAVCFRTFLRTQPSSIGRAIKAYLPLVPVQPIYRLPSRRHLHKVPFWIAFPTVLGECRVPKDLRDDILWAQYCVYLSERLRDDFLDGHTKDQRLRKLPARFDQLAEETLSRHFRRDGYFWKRYRVLRHVTSSAVRQADTAQQKIHKHPERLLRVYARVGSIFKLGTMAICILLDRLDMLQTLEQIEDDIVVGSQITDDMVDLVEDLKRKRYNYAAQMLLVAADKAAGRLDQRLLKAILHPGNAESVLDAALERFMRARNQLLRHNLPSLATIPLAHEMATRRLKNDLLRKRITLLFGKR